MSQDKLTKKQQEVLDCIKDHYLKRGFPPSVREICETVHLKSTSSVHAHLETLEKLGYIRRDPTKPRAIEILDDSLVRAEITSIPIVGHVAAGQPILAEDNIEGYFQVPMEFLPNQELFIMTVKGDSMINVGIFEGDYLIVASQQSAQNGDIVVALVEDSVTVKRFYKEEGHIRLQPENDAMEPILVSDCMILGKAVSLYRKSIF
ncbi:MAG: transcriptional repressor LexA [Lachnospiraceae bacterium]|nr:transcriptional repressor LexA [Lachnospiraceae bacterium]